MQISQYTPVGILGLGGEKCSLTVEQTLKRTEQNKKAVSFVALF